MATAQQIVMLEKRKALALAAKPRRGKAPVWLYPGAAEREYERELVQYAKDIWAQIKSTLVPLIYLENTAAKMDAYGDNIDNAITTLNIGLEPVVDGAKQKIQPIGRKTAEWNAAQWQKTVKKVMGVNTLLYVPRIQDALKSFAVENVGLITSIKDKAVSDVGTFAQRAVRSGMRHEEIAAEIEKQFEATKNRAKLIARDQVAKLNGQLTKTRQQDLGLDEYIWHTATDDRVRKNHRGMEGKKCRWDDPSVYWSGSEWAPRSAIGGIETHPGFDIQCRCWAEPVFDAIYQAIDNGIPAPPAPTPAPKPSPKPAAEKTAIPASLPFKGSGFNRTSRVAAPLVKDRKEFKKIIEARGLSTNGKIGGASGEIAPEVLSLMVERASWYYYNMGIKTDLYAVSTSRKYYAMNTYYGLTKQTKLTLSTIMKSSSTAQPSLTLGVQKEFHPVGCDTIKSIIDHEYGHTIWNTKLTIEGKRKLQELYGRYFSVDIKYQLSQYGSKNVQEFVSEGWAEYTNNPECRGLARDIAKIIKENYND